MRSQHFIPAAYLAINVANVIWHAYFWMEPSYAFFSEILPILGTAATATLVCVSKKTLLMTGAILSGYAICQYPLWEGLFTLWAWGHGGFS